MNFCTIKNVECCVVEIFYSCYHILAKHEGGLWNHQKVMSIFWSGGHHWTKWFHFKNWHLLWYVIDAQFTTINTLHDMEGIVSISCMASYGLLPWLLVDPRSANWKVCCLNYQIMSKSPKALLFHVKFCLIQVEVWHEEVLVFWFSTCGQKPLPKFNPLIEFF